MTLSIKVETKPMNIYSMELVPMYIEEGEREVYIDGQRVPKGLEMVILAGLDSLSRDHFEAIEKMMKTEGWRYPANE